jgi:hypothetical protein
VSNDFVIGNGDHSGSGSKSHFRVDGASSDVHVGRYADQSAIAGASNKLYLHTVNDSQQSKAVSLVRLLTCRLTFL